MRSWRLTKSANSGIATEHVRLRREVASVRGTERPTVRLPRYTGAETLFLFVDADFGGSANEFCYDAGRLWKRNGSSPTFAPSATALTAQSRQSKA
jgi:hypothetical protein